MDPSSGALGQGRGSLSALQGSLNQPHARARRCCPGSVCPARLCLVCQGQLARLGTVPGQPGHQQELGLLPAELRGSLTLQSHQQPRQLWALSFWNNPRLGLD